MKMMMMDAHVNGNRHAEIKEGEVVCDPMCGVGTLLIEAVQEWSVVFIIFILSLHLLHHHHLSSPSPSPSLSSSHIQHAVLTDADV